MATYQTRAGRVTATVRKKGHPQVSRTFPSKTLAEQWAAEVEGDIDRGSLVNHAEIRDTTVAQVLRRFDKEVVPTRKGWRWERNRINVWLKEQWSLLSLHQDIPEALRRWRDRRLVEVSPATINRDLNLLGGIFTHARTEWGIKIDNPAHNVKRPQAPSGMREVTWPDADIARFLQHLEFDETVKPSATQEVGWAMRLLRLLGVRRGSLCATRLEWIDLPGRCIHYPPDVVKNGEAYDCPLSREAEAALRVLMGHREGEDKLFHSSADTITTLFIRARHELAVAHPHVAKLRLHDLRHTWTTAVVSSPKRIDQLTLLKLSGRKSLTTLARYYNPKAEDLAALMD